MAQIRYTKTELRLQQIRLMQLNRYLPTLQLKKGLLQLEINEIDEMIGRLIARQESIENQVSSYSSLLTSPDAMELLQGCSILSLRKRFENIAGVEVPIFEGIDFEEPDYSLFDTPFWLDSALEGMRRLIESREELTMLKEKRRLLEKELRDVSIRVNLFEKIMIPRTLEYIKKIKIFLGDQQLAAVCQAKVAKQKILARKGKA